MHYEKQNSNIKGLEWSRQLVKGKQKHKKLSFVPEMLWWIGVEMTKIEKKSKEFTDYLYDAYGSGTGVLFGIPPHCKDAVQTIVKLVMEKQKNEYKVKKWD